MAKIEIDKQSDKIIFIEGEESFVREFYSDFKGSKNKKEEVEKKHWIGIKDYGKLWSAIINIFIFIALCIIIYFISDFLVNYFYPKVYSDKFRFFWSSLFLILGFSSYLFYDSRKENSHEKVWYTIRRYLFKQLIILIMLSFLIHSLFKIWDLEDLFYFVSTPISFFTPFILVPLIFNLDKANDLIKMVHRIFKE